MVIESRSPHAESPYDCFAMPLPEELLDAVGAALDRDAQQVDLRERARLLALARTAVDAWPCGRITTTEAIALLGTEARA